MSTIGANRFPELRTTEVYDSYWRFAAKRQDIFFKRLDDPTGPWTDDPILLKHKFTNAYRASDRASQFLIREVIYGQGRSTEPEEVIFRTILFKLFNKIGTWRRLEAAVGPLTWKGFNFERLDRALLAVMERGLPIYSAAYIIPPVNRLDRLKHRGHLRLVEHMLSTGFAARLVRAGSLSDVFWLLKEQRSFGDFIAFQLSVDLNYTELIDFDEDDFVVAGPGARDGISKCFVNAADIAPEDIIELMRARQGDEFARLNLDFKKLWGRQLHLIDCQNLFCEISKYARVAHPEVVGVSGRLRIKQMFRPTAEPFEPWYPPKWGLNNKIPCIPPQRNLFTERAA